jgi:ribonuclease HII
VNERFTFDLDLVGRGAVAGADEAGRGCLAGPLMAAAVCFDYATFRDEDFAALDDLNDSKRLTRERRDELYSRVLGLAHQAVVVACSPGTIDRRGLHVCNLASLARAVEAIEPPPDATLIDGFALPGCARPHQALVGGDGRSAAIAAASIIAKVSRDRLMATLHERFPQYGFDHHVGYATEVHHDAILEHGVCELHRMSFASVAYQQLGLLDSGGVPAGVTR